MDCRIIHGDRQCYWFQLYFHTFLQLRANIQSSLHIGDDLSKMGAPQVGHQNRQVAYGQSTLAEQYEVYPFMSHHDGSFRSKEYKRLEIDL